MSRRFRWFVACAGVETLALPFAGAAPASLRAASVARYVVVLKQGHSAAGIAAVAKAGGLVVAVNKIGIATVLASKPSFTTTLRATGAVAAVAPDASFGSRPIAS